MAAVPKRTVRVRAVIPYLGKYLFVRHNHDDSFWALPGGKVEDGEKLEDAMRREIVEELGITPKVGRVLYIHQLFREDEESLEFFFEVTNGEDFADLDLSRTTHGELELAAAEFIDPAHEYVLPEFMAGVADDMAEGDWPKLLVRTAIR